MPPCPTTKMVHAPPPHSYPPSSVPSSDAPPLDAGLAELDKSTVAVEGYISPGDEASYLSVDWSQEEEKRVVRK